LLPGPLAGILLINSFSFDGDPRSTGTNATLTVEDGVTSRVRSSVTKVLSGNCGIQLWDSLQYLGDVGSHLVSQMVAGFGSVAKTRAI